MFLYRTLLALLSPLIVVHAIYKGLRFRSYRYIRQRLGFGYSSIPKGCHWLHCASVGEAITAMPLIDELHKRHPASHFIVTTNTVTGASVVERQMAKRDYLHHAFLPIDWQSAVMHFLGKTLPSQLIIVETELWPNLIATANECRLKITIVNGRLSSRTTISNSWVRSVYAETLGHIDNIYARNFEDADAFIQLGADPLKVSVLGNLKYAPPSLNVAEQTITKRRYVLVASTHDDEELQIAKRWLALGRKELLVIAPRHPERSDRILKQLAALTPQIARRSQNELVTETTSIYLLDTVGELMGWFTTARLIIMGGSFVDVGGHNILEAAHFGKSVLFGPHMKNFSEESEYLLRHKAAIQCKDYDMLEKWMGRLLQDPRALYALDMNARNAMQPYEHVVEDYADKLLA